MGDQPKILIVDDEKIVCDMIRRSFEHEGYSVTTYTDSTEALAALQEERFDVVVTDLKMKEVDGIELLELTKTKWPGTKVIILTAFPTVATAVDAIRAQAFDYFTKPARIADVKESVKRALRGEAPRREEKTHG